MLHHRLSIEGQVSSSMLDEAAYAVDQISRIDARVVAAATVVLDLSGCIAVCFASGSKLAIASHGLPTFVLAGLAMPILFWLACSYVTGLYDQKILRSGSLQVLPALVTTCLAFLPSLGSGGFADLNSEAPSPALIAFLCQLAVVVCVRGVWSFVLGILLRRGVCLERVVVLASSLSAARVLSASLEYRTRGRLRVAVSAAIPRPGDESALRWLGEITSRHGTDRILIVDNGGDSQRLHEIIIALGPKGTDLTMISEDGSAYRLGGQHSSLPRLGDCAPPLTARQLLYKRTFDICVSSIALLALSPLLMVLATVIQFDSKGRVLFRQTRQGLNGRLFEIIKFRTMHEHLADPDCTVQTIRGDPRVTRVGGFLRGTSLDELPQLINVLRGEMSIVGPRPHALGMTVGGKPVSRAVIGYESRLRVKPGITGWAQVNGSRGEIRATKALRQRVALDCHYIENWSLKTDMRILLRTAALIFWDDYAF